MTAHSISSSSSSSSESDFGAYHIQPRPPVPTPLSTNQARSESNGDSVESEASSSYVPFWRSGQQVPRHAAPPPPPRDKKPALIQVCRLSQDVATQELANSHGLTVVDIAWEDMDRDKFSVLGPNITDVSLRAKGFSRPCSIIRKPNYTDHTGDFSISQFQIKVGNKEGDPLRNVPLRKYINDIFRHYGALQEVIAPSHEVLVSAQSCVIPLSSGRQEFNIEMYNYKTKSPYPGCLTIVSSAEGSSSQISTRTGSHLLFHNQDGSKCNFFAERLKDVRVREGRPVEGPVTAEEDEKRVLLVFQVPLKVPQRKSVLAPPPPGRAARGAGTSQDPPTLPPLCGVRRASAPSYGSAASYVGTDHAQIGHTAPVGQFHPYHGDLIFDNEAAIRGTVQHYVVTDRPSLRKSDVAEMASFIDSVYEGANRQGSLVVDDDAETRATAPQHGPSDGRERLKPWFLAP